MIPQETVDKILDYAKVEEVIGDFVTLKRQGANYLACCPFHNEKTPSFTISPSKGFYYCFGCHEGGNAVGFLMKHENMTYVDALRYLARKYNIEIIEEEQSADDIIARQHNESLYLVSEFAQKFFASNLDDGEGRALGYQYYKSRGLEDETIRKFGLGWCPSDRYALLNSARQAGYKEEYLIETGLCIKVEDSGKVYDRFHDRAVFPIYSLSGRVIGFSGRTLRSDKTVAKYVNSPETPIYNKSRTLFGMYFAKQQIAKENKCILVEGNLDMISLHQLGITNCVASCGTSLTVEQIRQIKRFTENVTIIYDGDSAGIHAALRGIGLVLQEGLNVKIVLLPDGQDPDDFSKTHTLQEFKDFIARNERDFITFKTDLLLDDIADDPLKKAELINDIADTIALIPDEVKRATYTESTARRFEMDKATLGRRVSGTRVHVEEEQKKQWERERKERERAEAEKASGEVVTETVDLGGATGKKRVVLPPILEAAEKSLMDFILRSGTEIMKFTKDSEFYTEEPMTVADFIDSSLASDNIVLSNEAFRLTYDAYFELYDKGLEQEDIIRALVASQDTDVVRTAVEMTVQKYEVTEKHLKNSMTNTTTILTHEVPRAIILYHVRLMDKQLEDCRKKLKDPTEDTMEIMKEISRINQQRNILNNKLGRI